MRVASILTAMLLGAGCGDSGFDPPSLFAPHAFASQRQ